MERKIVTSRDIYKKEPRMDFVKSNQYLQDVKKVLDEFNIPFFLFFGTLLGAIREQDFLVHDHDVDIAVFAKDIDNTKTDKISAELTKLGYTVGSCSVLGRKSALLVSKPKNKGTKVDIYYFFDFQDKLWWPRGSYIKGVSYITAIPYKKKYFENMKTISFKGAEYKVPTPPEEFLEELWGKWWIATWGQFGIIKATHFKPEEFKPKEL